MADVGGITVHTSKFPPDTVSCKLTTSTIAVEKHIDGPDVIGDFDDNRHPGKPKASGLFSFSN